MHNESKLQQECLKWFKYQYPRYVIFSIPNGGARNKREAAILKGEGVLSGVSDVFLMYENGKHNGLFIEFKIAKGRQTESQKWFEQKAKEFFYEYKVVRSFDEFQAVINEYIK